MIVQHMLAPMDFIATADQALAYAIALGQELQARLTLLHVLDLTPVTMDEMTVGMTTTYLDDLETEAQHLLQASRERVQRAGLQGECLLVQGTPTQTIVDTAGEQGVDLGCRTFSACISKRFGGFCSRLLKLRTGKLSSAFRLHGFADIC